MKKAHRDRKNDTPPFFWIILGMILLLMAMFCGARFVLTRRGFVPARKVLEASGYQREGTFPWGTRYKSQDGAVTIDFSLEERVVYKNQYTFRAAGKVARSFGILYADAGLLEDVLDIRILSCSLWGAKVETVSASPLAWDTRLAPFIAHAGSGYVGRDEEGKLELITYTNSLECITRAYQSGYRVFEIDFSVTSDGELVAVHNWEKQYGQKLSYEEYMSSSPWGLTQLDLYGVMKEMAVNKDVLVVLDFKPYFGNNKKKAKGFQKIYEAALECGGEELVQRLIPQIYDTSELEAVLKVYPWKVLYSLYRDKEKPAEEILAFLEAEPSVIGVVTKYNRATEELSDGVHALGRSMLIYTVDELDKLYNYLNLGVDGFFTNCMPPAGWTSLFGDQESHLFPPAL